MKWHRYSCYFFHVCSQMICRHCSEQQELLSLVREGGEGSRQSLSFPLNFCTCLPCFACQHNTYPTTWFCCHQVDYDYIILSCMKIEELSCCICLLDDLYCNKECSGTLALGWVKILKCCFGCPFTSLQKELLTEQTLEEPQYQWNAMMMKMRPSAALFFIWVGHWTWSPVVHDITY